MKTIAVVIYAAVTVALGIVSGMGAQRNTQPPFIEFGGAKVSLGMSVQQVNNSLAQSARHLQFLPDKQTASVEKIGVPWPDSDEGQVTFIGGRAVFAAFQFPFTRDANTLAQEIAGAIDNMNSKICTVRNFSSHGTGGGHSEIIFNCGLKNFTVTTEEPLGGNRQTNVEIWVGELGTK